MPLGRPSGCLSLETIRISGAPSRLNCIIGCTCSGPKRAEKAMCCSGVSSWSRNTTTPCSRCAFLSSAKVPSSRRARSTSVTSAKNVSPSLRTFISLGVLDGLERSRTEDLVRQALGGRRGQPSEVLLVQGNHRSRTGNLFPLLVEPVGALLQHLVPLLLLHLEEEVLHHLLVRRLDAAPGALREHDLVEAEAEVALDPVLHHLVVLHGHHQRAERHLAIDHALLQRRVDLVERHRDRVGADRLDALDHALDRAAADLEALEIAPRGGLRLGLDG